MRVRAHSAIVYLFQETFVILYWIGLWSLIDPTERSAAVQVVCLLVGFLGLLCVKAFEPRMILRSIDATTEGFAASAPSVHRMERFVDYTLRSELGRQGRKDVR